MSEAKKKTVTYFLDGSDSGFNGGAKAKVDCGLLWRRQGLTPIVLSSRSMIGRIPKFFSLFYISFVAPRSSVVMHYPIYNFTGLFAQKLLRYRHRLVLAVHDIDKERGVSPTQDIGALACADGIIVSGQLGKFIPPASKKRTSVTLGAWDYLTNVEPESWSSDGAILYAGNLSPSKSPWLYVKARRTPLLVAGEGYDEKLAVEKDRYLGRFPPGLPTFKGASWGLVWDGESAFKTEGSTGNYQRWNQPHKFSMYLAAGLPIICSRTAFIARTVADNNLGVVVDSVDDAEDVIQSMTHEQLEAVRAGVTDFRKKIISGAFLTAAMDELRLSKVI